MSGDAGESGPATRAERRRRSETVIRDAAGALFAEHGYERTTIRAVADRAGVDPALVMQNFGSKEALFAAAARWSTPLDGLVAAGRTELPQAALEHVLDTFEDPERRAAAEALLRSCLTHPAAQAVLRDQVMGAAQQRVASTIGGPDAALRAALLNACVLGLTISRYLVEVPAVADATATDLERVLRPALERLVEPT
ncbi:TetR/AcrR family transcriptional regulator [Pseudonocardia parietis]|uniref:AcrR family transcriptional regulator n=1 Tax=Pseudonocardia parietis TaxID=570936 RepID=A0ABS4W4U3_9PSEU|nr:TetR/AcrR family transcriptional regulator [Pseudonocardia parietis]MBP2371242.1 AcrR family transcriptional regulator [Pseudonocardia parietis]